MLGGWKSTVLKKMYVYIYIYIYIYIHTYFLRNKVSKL